MFQHHVENAQRLVGDLTKFEIWQTLDHCTGMNRKSADNSLSAEKTSNPDSTIWTMEKRKVTQTTGSIGEKKQKQTKKDGSQATCNQWNISKESQSTMKISNFFSEKLTCVSNHVCISLF